SQTVGPFLSIGFGALAVEVLAAEGVNGERLAVQGRLLDGDGKGVSDGVIELWQANAYGRYASPEDPQNKPVEPGFRGFVVSSPVPTAALDSRPSSRAGCPDRVGRCRQRTWP